MLKKKAASGFFWMFSERICAQVVTLCVSIVLARILFPDDYGLVVAAQILINIANVFVSHGLNVALIQKDDPDENDYATAFYATFALTVVIYFVLFFLAPLFSVAVKLSGFISLFRVLSLRIIIGSLNTVQRAFVSKNLLFKKFFFSTLIGTAISAFVGIGMALMGFGAWAIVGQYLSNVVIDSIVLWITVNWHPTRRFSLVKMREMISYSWRISLAELFNEIYLEIRSFVIGGNYSTRELAFYNRGKQFPQLFFTNIISAITSVLFPIMSNEKKDSRLLKSGTKTSLDVASYVIFPLMMILVLTSEQLISVILTDRWLPCATYLRIYSLCYAILPIQSILEQLYKAIGRSDIVFNLFLVEKIVGVLIIICTMRHGVFAIAIGMLVSAIFSTVAHTLPIKRTLGSGIIELFGNVFENAAYTFVAASIAFFSARLVKNNIVSLILQIVVLLTAYLCISVYFKSKALLDIVQIVYSFHKNGLLILLEKKLKDGRVES